MGLDPLLPLQFIQS